ncbi:MAG: response regulator [Rhodospirillaceae bacterium]|nr:response regulator [Rhodospirillales bacterium]
MVEPDDQFEPDQAADADDSEWELGNQLMMLAQAANQQVTILVVDDEPEIVEEITEDLEFEGYSCRSAANAQEALDVIAEDDTIAVIVSDIRMPNMDGLEFIAAINERWPNRALQIIMLTGHAGYDEAVQALRLGAFEFLAKPVSLGHLAHVINRAKEVLSLKAHERNLREFLVREIARLNTQIDHLREENEELRGSAAE